MYQRAEPSFLVVIPSIRQNREGFKDVQKRVEATFRFETEYHLLDGREGKAATLNQAFDDLLSVSHHDYYVTMDDDYVPGNNWQEMIDLAFHDLPELGAASCWVGDDPELQELIGAYRLDTPRKTKHIEWRKVQRGHHIAGALIAYKTSVARQCGKQPITQEKYQVWEDAWRGRRVQSLGYDLGFITCDLPEFIWYEDPPEYIKWREDQVIRSRKNQDEMLKLSGISDPWHLQLRRKIAKLRGRSPD